MRNTREILKGVLLGVIFAIVIFWSLFPIYFAGLISVSPEGGIPLRLGLPRAFSFLAWQKVLFDPTIWSSMLNSLIVAASASLLTLLIAVPAAYTFSRRQKRMDRLIFLFLLFFRMIPLMAFAIPLYYLMTRLGLLGTYIGLSVSHLIFTVPLSAWLMKGFFDLVPIEIEESAEMDGASKLRTLIGIVLPIAAGGIGVAIMFSFLFSYTEYLFALILATGGFITMPMKIAGYQTIWVLAFREMAVGVFIGSIPSIVLFLFLQKYMVRGLTFGALKGR